MHGFAGLRLVGYHRGGVARRSRLWRCTKRRWRFLMRTSVSVVALSTAKSQVECGARSSVHVSIKTPGTETLHQCGLVLAQYVLNWVRHPPTEIGDHRLYQSGKQGWGGVAAHVQTCPSGVNHQVTQDTGWGRALR